ncbi:MAG: S41 family peptidase [Alistipes sp.]|nr:S41 family peptidase [Alistipes sp.]
MKATLIALSLAFTFSTAYPSGPERQDISRLQAIADIDSMTAYIRGTHPDMFAHCPEEVYNATADRVKASLPDSMDIAELYKHIGILPPLLGDGHTSIYSGDVFKVFDGIPVFPLFMKFDLTDGSFYLPHSHKRVVSVNGHDAEEIAARMKTYASGESDAFRLQRVELEFPALMHLLYPAGEYTIAYVDEDALTDQIEYMTVDAAPVDLGKDYPFALSAEAPYSYSFMDDISTCVLDFRKFNGLEKFSELIREMFTEMERRGTENLIIDLRRNGGGNSELGDELFQYISPCPFLQYGGMTVRVSRYLREAFNNNDLGAEDGIHTFDNTPDDLIGLRDNPLRFTGKGNIYLLTGTYTFSSAADFVWAFQYFGMGTVVGEETGGWIVCFGDVIHRRMPNSGIPVGCSWKKFYGYGATDDDTHGVIPDHPVAADRALDYTVELIRNGRPVR